ncbi:MAG: Hsp20/alpha crystallin family protein [Thermoproteota archaeon]|nr:Hsp20/alpha crystallin family protein [Thermoproteota archaeon]
MAGFDEIFRDMDAYFKKVTERMSKEIEELTKAVQTGKLRGKWDVTPIDKPGVQGYVIRGWFQLGEPPQIPKGVIEEVREPLVDVFEDEDQVKLYVELPGAEKEDIQLNIADGKAEVKAKNFYKRINLPTKDVEFKKASTSYKNGVLEVTVPKKKTTKKEKKRNTA